MKNIILSAVILLSLNTRCDYGSEFLKNKLHILQEFLADQLYKAFTLPFNFHVIAQDIQTSNNQSNTIAYVEFNNNTILAIHDGKKTPLILSSIPYDRIHLNKVKKHLNLESNQQVEIFSLNEQHERDIFGLSKLIQDNNDVQLYKYPTVYRAPCSLIDILRGVRDLENRDLRNSNFVIVHCKMGAGRSPLMVAAYLVHIAHKIGALVSVDHILQYLKRKRPQVWLVPEQKKAIEMFHTALKNAGNFESLYNTHISSVVDRDQEVMNL